MAGAELGGDGDEFPVEPLDGEVLQMVLERALKRWPVIRPEPPKLTSRKPNTRRRVSGAGEVF